MARNVGIVVGCSVGTLLACIAGYWTNKEYNKNVEVGPRTGKAEEDNGTDTDDTGTEEGEEGEKEVTPDKYLS